MSKENEKNQTQQQPAPAVPDWELRRDPAAEQFEPEVEKDAEQEPEELLDRQLRELRAQKEHSILTNSSMLSDLQEKYDALLKERDSQKALIDSLQTENDANRAEADTLRIQSAAEAALFTAQDAYNHGRYSACREALAGINPDALSPQAKLVYDNLQRRVG